MSTAPRCIAASLALHASLVGLASSDAVSERPAHAAMSPQSFEGYISVEGTSHGSDSSAVNRRERAQTPTDAQGEPDEARPRAQRAPRPQRPLQPRVIPPAAAARAPEPASDSSQTAPPAFVPGRPNETDAVVPQPRASPAGAGLAPAAAATAARHTGVPEGSGGSARAGAATAGNTASPGGGGGGVASRGPLLARYLEGVRERVARHREYPYLARRAHLEGTICLRVSIGAGGEVLSVTATCGNDNRPLLGAAVRSVSRAAPFPPLPAALGREITLDVPLVFDLDNM